MAHVGRYFVLGSTAFPTFLYYWYKFLDGGTKYWKGMTGKTVPAIAAKVVVDQLVTAPPILSTFYVGKIQINEFSQQMCSLDLAMSSHLTNKRRGAQKEQQFL